MNIKIYIAAAMSMLLMQGAWAQQTTETAQTSADTTRQAEPQIDSAALIRRQTPVRPVHTLGQVEAIDTLPTGNDALQIVLFNDNTWRYVLSKDYVQDTTVFTDHWATASVHAYNDVELSSLPEATAIALVDSLKSYHYPYKGRISSRYGLRRGRPHQGTDLPLKVGDPIYATFDGQVRFSGYNNGGYGNLIIVRHNNGLETFYGHLSERMVEPGEWVVAGQQIGKGGNTGKSSGPHLHFEVRYKGQSFDPERVIDFETGILRREELLLKRRHFSIYSKFDQNFDDEEANEKQDEAERKAAEAIQYHTIRKGDTLGAIARKYHTTVKRLCQLNGIKETTILRLGKRLRVR